MTIFGSLCLALNTHKHVLHNVKIKGIPQTLLQVYIFLRIALDRAALDSNNINENYYGLNIQDLSLSLGVSFLNLCINFYQFRREAKLHGTTITLYALSVLQMAEVPIQKFVPRLPAIEKGEVESVNFGGFKFDKASVTPLLEALHSVKCKLKMIRLSIASFSLDIFNSNFIMFS